MKTPVTVTKRQHRYIYILIFIRAVGILGAMFRFVVLVFSIVWASLLLISWSGAETSPTGSANPPSVHYSSHN